jgi:capsular polysaccharide biosynthesis protein/Mrp family chromosome partitioning ATPase
MEQQGYFQIFRERWRSVLIGTFAGLAIATVVAFVIPPTYTSSATLLLSVDSREGSLSDRSTFALERISSYPELAYSPDVLGATIDDLDLTESPEKLGDRITASNPTTTLLLRIGAEADSPQAAADLANTVAKNLADVVTDIENSSRNTAVTTSLDLTNPAAVPSGPSSPQRVLILGLGLLSGIAAGLIGAILRARVDTSIRTVAQLRRISGLPVLGQWSPPSHERRGLSLPARKGASVDTTVVESTGNAAPTPASDETRTATTPDARLAHQMRETQLALRQANAATMPSILLLVPSDSSAADARELVDLARSVADTGRRVCLVESAAPLGLSTLLPKGRKGKGLVGVMAGAQVLKTAVVPVEGEPFSLLPAGDPDATPSETVVEDKMGGVAEQLATAFDTVIIEATSVTRPVSLEVAAPHADGILILTHYGTTREADVAHTLARLRLLGVRPLGVIMTGVPASKTIDLVATWLPGDFDRPVSPSTPVELDSDAPAPAGG